MGCCDDGKGSLPDPSAQEEEEVGLDEHANTANDEAITVQADDVWATAEGYTPLADLHGSNPYEQTMMVAFGPDDDSENDEHGAPSSFSGAFFVNPSAFAAEADDADDDEDEEEQEEMTGATSNVGQQEYQSIADTALLALDEEYQRTIATIPPPPQPVCLDDDLKAIAAAFASYSMHVKKDDDGTFDVSWDNVVSTATTQNAAVKPPVKAEVEVDTAAVTKAVQALNNSTKSPFQQKFATWQQQQQQQHHQSHPIIPDTPLKAFRRTTEKAKKATSTLTRSATLAQALTKLESMNLLFASASASTLENNSTLCVHIVGVDHVECESPARLQTLFRPLIRWLSNWKCKFPVKHVKLVLIGRDLNPRACANPVDLIVTTTPSLSSTIQTAVAVCHTGVYHEWLASASSNDGTSSTSQQQPHLVIAFNAGIWGYQEWKPTLEYLNARETNTPVVITAYTLPESQEDHAIFLEEMLLPPSQCLWGPEPNPFGSNVQAPHSSNHEYRENAAWQAWNLGGI
jgi:hypothetical protein